MVDVEVSKDGETTYITYGDWQLELEAVRIGEVTTIGDFVLIEDPIAEIYIAHAPLVGHGELTGYGETKEGAKQMLEYEIKLFENGEKSMFDTSSREVLSFDRPQEDDEGLL